MAKEKFERSKPHVNVGTIGHVDHGKTTRPLPLSSTVLSKVERKQAAPANEAPQVQADARDAARYRWLRARDLETIGQGGVFAGMTPQNVILNGHDLDDAIDAAIAAQAKQGCA